MTSPVLEAITGKALEMAVEQYGEEGWFILTKEDLLYLEARPDDIAKDVEEALKKRAQELGKSFLFSIEPGNHRSFGDSFYISWKANGPSSGEHQGAGTDAGTPSGVGN